MSGAVLKVVEPAELVAERALVNRVSHGRAVRGTVKGNVKYDT